MCGVGAGVGVQCVVCGVCGVWCVVCCVCCVCGAAWHAENSPCVGSKTSSCVGSKRLRVYVQNASVCTGKTPAFEWMWRTVSSQHLTMNCTECCHLSSSLLFSPPSLLPDSHTQKKNEIGNFKKYPAREFISITVLINSKKIKTALSYSHYRFIFIRK